MDVLDAKVQEGEKDQDRLLLVPRDVVGDGKTVDNLREAAAGENHEYMHMYPDFAKIADEEGFPEIAVVMRSIARAEKQHEKRYLGLMEDIENGTLYKKVEKVLWKCNQCGFIYEGYEPPEKCPACAHPSGYFEVLAENW